MALSETWLSDDVFSSELFPNNYVSFRCDRRYDQMKVSRGGGVLLACRNDFNVEPLNFSDLLVALPTLDIVGCRCSFNSATVYIIVLYIPKTPSVYDLELLFHYLVEHFFQTNKILLLGDFNVPKFILNSNDPLCTLLQEYCNFLDLKQYNSVLNSNLNLLDLVFSNFHCEVERCDLPLIKEDILYHPSIVVHFSLMIPLRNIFPINPQNRKYNFKRADYPALYESLESLDWSVLEQCNDVNSACDTFYFILYDVLDKFVPYYENKKHAYKYPTWYTSDIISCIKEKSKTFKRFKRTHSVVDLNSFKSLRARAKFLIREAYISHIHNIESSIRADSTNFWRFINSKRNSSRIPSEMCMNNTTLSQPNAIVESFCEQFSQEFHTSGVFSQINCAASDMPIISVEYVSEDDVAKAIRKLKNKATAGDDQVPSFLIRDCSAVFLLPLKIIFNLSLQSATYPSAWKIARVCPVFKSGDVKDVANYRPISILNNFSKVFESVIYNNINPHILNSISDCQHGFVSRRSTVTNLICISQYLREVVDRRGQVDVIYTDLAKAFDRLDHAILLQKLLSFGFSPRLLEFFRSYLCDRSFYVCYNGYASSSRSVTSGVPQGSLLGPLLFIVFANDITSVINCKILLFADDVKLFSSVSSQDSCTFLQNNLNRLVEWCSLNKLLLNTSKCHIMSYTRRLLPVTYDYRIHGETLSRLTIVKDLGVTFDSELSFTQHISAICDSSNKMLGFVLRNCASFTHSSTMISLYCSLIRSRLEYASLIWNPFYAIHRNNLENVQRKFLKYLWYRTYNYYPDRGFDHDVLLRNFNFPALATRRSCAGLKFLYKTIHNDIVCPEILYSLKFHVPRPSARYAPTFFLPTAHTNLLLHSPIYFVCSTYNLICRYVDIFNCNCKELIVTYMNYLSDMF